MISYLPYIFSQLIQPLNLLLMVAGTAVGIIFGAIPGLSGTMAVMLFMPLTYTMESRSGEQGAGHRYDGLFRWYLLQRHYRRSAR